MIDNDKTDSDSGRPEGEPAAAAETNPTAPSGPSFAELGLGPAVLGALTEMGFTHPMKVQAATVPLVQEGRDLMVQSRTGSGKTAAFGIPIIDKVVSAEEKFVQAIILLPTRELALQVASELTRIAAHSGITVVPVYGGAPMGRQIEQLKAGGQIVCGTPGRVMDHMRRGTLHLDRVRCAVLDECDEMLSMGFQEDIETILERTPSERQTLLFSATVPEGIQRLSRRFLRNPHNLKLSADFVGVQEIRHVYYTIPGGQRENELLRVLAFENPGRAIIFCNTREETGRVAEFLRRQGFDAEAISSDLAQNDRERVMGRMRAGEIRFLVATDVAARGIDLEALSHVINYTFPESPEIYIHRTGRTGRAGRHGTAISLIGPTEVGAFYYVKLLYKIKPEERSLPSEAEIRSKREGERLEALRVHVTGEPGNTWRSLARRVMAAVDGERLCAGLLAEVFAGQKLKAEAAALAAGETPAVVATQVVAAREASPPARPSRERSRDRDRGDRDRPRYGADREARGGREGERGRDSERPARPSGDRPRFGERGREGDRPRFSERSSRPESGREPSSENGQPAIANGTGPAPSPGVTTPPANAEVPASAAGTAETADAGASEPSRSRESRYGERARRSRDRGERTERGERERGPRPPRDFGRDARPEEAAAAAPAAPPSDLPVPSREPERPRRSDSGGRGPSSKAQGDQEFWSVWSDAPSSAPPRPRAEASSAPATVASEESDAAGTDARLFLNLGRKDDASMDEVSALFADLGVTVAPGDIDLMNTHSYVNVPAAEADRLCAGLSGRDRNGRPLLCERARPRRR